MTTPLEIIKKAEEEMYEPFGDGPKDFQNKAFKDLLTALIEQVEGRVCNKCRDVLHSYYAIQKQGEKEGTN